MQNWGRIGVGAVGIASDGRIQRGAAEDPTWAASGSRAGAGSIHAIHVLFAPSDLPGLSSWPPYRTEAVRAAARALAALGCAHLGGRLQIISDVLLVPEQVGAAGEFLATVRAVEDAFAGGHREFNNHRTGLLEGLRTEPGNDWRFAAVDLDFFSLP